MTTDDAALFDCQHCGACCQPDQGLDHFVLLDEADRARLPPSVRAEVREVEGRTYLRTVPTRSPGGSLGQACVALRRTPTRVKGCAIYAARPEACRTFEFGALSCRMARAARNLAAFGPFLEARYELGLRALAAGEAAEDVSLRYGLNTRDLLTRAHAHANPNAAGASTP